MKKKKSGISLIVLVITIIVIIILAVAVILSIANNNPIQNSKEAKFKSDLKSIEEELELVKSSNYAENKGASYNNKDGSEISLNNLSAAQKYQDKLVINEGELKYLTSKLSTEEIEWAKELGIEAGGIVLKDGENGIKIKNGTINTEDWLDSDSGDPSKTLPKELENTELIIPNNVTKIPDFTFYACDLKSIKLPNTITSIGDGAFGQCSSLTSVNIPNSVTSWGYEIFKGTKITSIVIPDGIKYLGNDVFSGCKELKNVVLPDSLESISGFSGCTSLTNITIPSSVTSIGSGAFGGCTGIKSIIIPEGVKTIGDSAFSDTGLESITIPSSVTRVGACAFYNNSSLTSMVIEGEPRFKQSEIEGVNDPPGWEIDASKVAITGTGYIAGE